MTSKILALTDALGNLVRFVLLPGQRHDMTGVAPLIKDVEFGGLIAGKAFDANWLIADLNQRGAKVVISQMPQRRAPLDIDLPVYKWRHLIESFSANSRSSSVLQCAVIRPIRAFVPWSISLQPLSTRAESQQALANIHKSYGVEALERCLTISAHFDRAQMLSELRRSWRSQQCTILWYYLQADILSTYKLGLSVIGMASS